MVDWSRTKLAVEVLIAVGTFATTTLAFVAKESADRAASKLEVVRTDLARQDQQLKVQAQLLEESRQLNDYNLRVFEQVVDALKARDERLERVATALVEAMPASNPLRAQMLLAISVGASSEVAKAQATFAAEEPVPAPAAAAPDASPQQEVAPVPVTRAWNVDVLYCETAPDGEARARQVQRALTGVTLAGAASAGRVRVRKLPEAINARAGYQVQGLQVRGEADEDAATAALQQLAARALGVDARSLQRVRTGSPTPGYLSLFLCP